MRLAGWMLAWCWRHRLHGIRCHESEKAWREVVDSCKRFEELSLALRIPDVDPPGVQAAWSIVFHQLLDCWVGEIESDISTVFSEV